MGAPQTDILNRLSALLPESVQGWTAGAADDIYDPETIFSYIDGAGEVYRAYNFQRLLSRRFEKDGQPDIIADVFDMGTSADAFGVFTHDLDGDRPGIGQGATYKAGLLAFWRDRYFVSLFAERETAEARETLFVLGRDIAARIGCDGPKPSLLGVLPPGFADERSVRYLHSPVILNYHFFVSRENILRLEARTEALLLKMGEKGRDGVLLVVRYPGAKAASDAYRSFTGSYGPSGITGGLLQSADRTWTAAAVRTDLVMIVFGAPTAESAKGILAKIQYPTGQAGRVPR